jgi:hypothetical protein
VLSVPALNKRYEVMPEYKFHCSNAPLTNINSMPRIERGV